MRSIVVEKLRALLSEHRYLLQYGYKLSTGTFKVITITTNLYMLTDTELLDLYTWCVLTASEN